MPELNEPVPPITSERALPRPLKFLKSCGSCWWYWNGSAWYPTDRQECHPGCTCFPPSDGLSDGASRLQNEAVEWPCAPSMTVQRDRAINEVLRLASLVKWLQVALLTAILTAGVLAVGLMRSGQSWSDPTPVAELSE